MSRKNARKEAFQLVFQLPFHEGLDLNQAYEYQLKEFSDMSDSDKTFIYQEFKGVSENTDLIDSYIEKNLKKWKISRLEKEILAISRIAIYEMLFDDETPVAVSINEALELAKLYSDEQGRKFIHGLLSSVSRELSNEDNVSEEPILDGILEALEESNEK